MSQQQTPATSQQPVKTPAPVAPQPIDPSLLRQIGGGDGTGSPHTGW